MSKTADAIRELLDAGCSYAEVSARLGVGRQRVWSADRHRKGMGRPRQPRCEKCGGKVSCCHGEGR